MKINKWEIKTIKLALLEAIDSYEALIDAYRGDLGLTKISELDKETQNNLRNKKYKIKKFRELLKKLVT